MGIKILPPDVNYGEGRFTVAEDGIRYGMSAIKSVGDAVVDAIVEERRANGLFKDLKDYISRMSGKEANKRTIESFILAGAFDSFGANRKQMMTAYPDIASAVSAEKKKNASGQMSLLDFMSEEDSEQFQVDYPDVPEFSKDIILSGEKQMLGLYISGHPLDNVRELLEKQTNIKTSDFEIDEETGLVSAVDGRNYTLGGLIESINTRITRKGENMAILSIEDLYGSMEVIVFPQAYERYRSLLEVNNAVIIKGRAQVSDDESKLIASDIYSMESFVQKGNAESKELWVLFKNQADYMKNKGDFETVLGEHRGFTPVYVQLGEEKKGFRCPANVDLDTGIEEALILEYGRDRVLVRVKK